MFKLPEDTYKRYTKFLRKKEYKRAYRCLESLLHQFPDDITLLCNIVELSVILWNHPEKGRKWLIKLANIRSLWPDYLALSKVEAQLGNITRAKKYLNKAKELQKTQRSVNLPGVTPKKLFDETEHLIQYKEWDKEWNAVAKPEAPTKIESSATRVPKEKKDVSQVSKDRDKKIEIKSKPEIKIPTQKIQFPTYSIPVKIESVKDEALSSFIKSGISPLKEIQMLIDYTHLTIQSGFDELLCLNTLSGVEKYWYQIETVKKVLKRFYGRTLLCDEVGLGKTIETGMLIKEYLMRGMVRNILILTPASLVSQWKEEMLTKFGIEFTTTDDFEFTKNPANFWKQRFIIASLNTAKSNRNMPIVTERFYDLVVIDEAHHLINRRTLSWKLVNRIKKRFIFLLTATPVQNNLIELFNLITLLKPGQFKTEKNFRQEYVTKGNLKKPVNKERMQELLRDVLIRNTRSAIDLKLPKRYATTVRLEPTELEQEVYTRVTEYLKSLNLKKPIINLILREAESSPFALKSSLLTLSPGDEVKDIINTIDNLGDISKGRALIDILLKNPDEKKIIFTQFTKSMNYVIDLLGRHRIPHSTFRGNMSTREKDIAIARFKNEVPVLVSTELGGEGKNLQFCNTIINFDLPWNPMRIEQRIGRLHRIGQTRDVFIFNLSVKDTIEDYIIDILDNKINMFEMVIGEIEPILGYLGEDVEFDDIIMGIWLKSGDRKRLKQSFEQLGDELITAKQKYLESKTFDNELFGEDYEI